MNKLLKKMRKLTQQYEHLDRVPVQMSDIAGMCDLVENAVPSIDRLQDRLEQGCRLAKQDGRWWLFDAEGEGIAGGETLRDVLVNLIFMDC